MSQQGGVVPESARSPKTGRETGPIVGEVLGIGLPLRNLTTPKEEEGEIGIPKASTEFGTLLWKGTMEGLLRSVLSPLDDARMVPPGSLDIP